MYGHATDLMTGQLTGIGKLRMWEAPGRSPKRDGKLGWHGSRGTLLGRMHVSMIAKSTNSDTSNGDLVAGWMSSA